MIWNWVRELDRLRSQRIPAVLITVTRVVGSAPREVGAKMMVFKDQTIKGTIGGGQLESLAIADAVECFQTAKSKSVRYPLCYKAGQCCGGAVDIFFEVINMQPSLYIFGAGHVSQALTRVLMGTPFDIQISDQRKEWLEKLPEDIERHNCDSLELINKINFYPDRTYLIIMTHSHQHDEDIIAALIDKPCKYLGLIGSQTKWARFKQRLQAKGLTAHSLEKVRCPIGVNVGGKAPQEVAISVAAELLQFHYQGDVNITTEQTKLIKPQGQLRVRA